MMEVAEIELRVMAFPSTVAPVIVFRRSPVSLAVPVAFAARQLMSRRTGSGPVYGVGDVAAS